VAGTVRHRDELQEDPRPRRGVAPVRVALVAGAIVAISAAWTWAAEPVNAGAPLVSERAITTASTTPGPATTVVPLGGAVVRGRFVRRVSVSGLTVAPDPSAGPRPLGIDRREARRLAALTEGLGRPKAVGFGLVTITGVTPQAGAGTMTRRPAWVAIAPPNGLAFSCPVMTVPPTTTAQPPSPANGHGVYTAAVFFGSVAAAGDGAVLYQSTGLLPCGGTGKASLAQAHAAVPVAWSVVGPVGLTTRIEYQAPECSSLDSVAAGGTVTTGRYSVTVTVTVPFDRAGCGAVGTFTTTVSVYPQSAGPTAPAPPAHVALTPKPLPFVPPALVAPLG
jgi:hypothetical protein